MSTGYYVPTYGGPLMTSARFRREYLGERSVFARHHLPSWRTGRIGAIVIHVTSLADVATVIKEAEEATEHLALASSAQQLNGVVRSGRTALLICASYDDVGPNPDLLAVYERVGAVSFALSMNSRNLLVDGCAEPSASGLSAQGVQVVRQLRARGILIDVSHTSDAGFWDVLRTVDGGVFASHSNARALCENPRNLSDEMLRALADHGGIVGISTYPTLLAANGPATIDHALDHIAYMADLIGIDHVAVGGDFIDFAVEFVMPKIHATDFAGKLYGHEHIAPRGLGSISELPNVAHGLQRRGFSAGDIAKVMGGNFLRAWQEARGEAAQHEHP